MANKLLKGGMEKSAILPPLIGFVGAGRAAIYTIIVEITFITILRHGVYCGPIDHNFLCNGRLNHKIMSLINNHIIRNKQNSCAFY